MGEPKSSFNLDLLGVSVHHLETDFLNEVLRAGLFRCCNVYEIEDLAGPPGIIRRKGENVISPVDGKMGASYVRAISGEDHVGTANFMLSYSWGYSIGDIVDTRKRFCDDNDFDRKRTYSWICCLCVNRHRVVEQEEKSLALSNSSVDLEAEFRERVTGIGHILAMMGPWSDPLYLKRAWCVFEIFTAHHNGCKATIMMPPKERLSCNDTMMGDFEVFYNLCKAFTNTRIENAKVSAESDRVMIMEAVERAVGPVVLNREGNALFEGMGARGDSARRIHNRRKHGRFCHQAGMVFLRNEEYEESIRLLREAVAIRSSIREIHMSTGESHNSLGFALSKIGDHDLALDEFGKALALSKHFKAHEGSAMCYHNIGDELSAKGDLDGAIVAKLKALTTMEVYVGKNNKRSAFFYTSFGHALERKGSYDEAYIMYSKTMALYETHSDTSQEDIASGYRDLASVVFAKGDYAKAEEFRKRNSSSA